MGCLILSGEREYELDEFPRDADAGGVKCCQELRFSFCAPALGLWKDPCADGREGAANPPRAALFAPVLALPAFDGGVNVRHPGRDDCTALRALLPKPAAPLDALLNPETGCAPCCIEGVKKRCELGVAWLNAEGFAIRPDGLKLSREGVTGILPVIMLAWRRDASLILACCIETRERPNSLPAMELIPLRTRSFRKASSRFENRCPLKLLPTNGPNPSRLLMNVEL